jgi:ATP-dependent DNA ligase
VLGQAPVPMLAQLEWRLPVGEQWRYEPKLDGFRGLLWRRANGQVQLLSQNGRDLGDAFPELVRLAEAVNQHPAVLVVFDVLELAGAELAHSSLGCRRRELEQLLEGFHPCLQLVAQTADVSLAQDWLTLPNLEGCSREARDRPYLSGGCEIGLRSIDNAPSAA